MLAVMQRFLKASIWSQRKFSCSTPNPDYFTTAERNVAAGESHQKGLDRYLKFLKQKDVSICVADKDVKPYLQWLLRNSKICAGSSWVLRDLNRVFSLNSIEVQFPVPLPQQKLFVTFIARTLCGPSPVHTKSRFRIIPRTKAIQATKKRLIRTSEASIHGISARP